MENNDDYQQISEVNNTTQTGNEFLSQHLVEEVVTQNVNNQDPIENCELSGIEILLPNDYIHVQEQGNNDIVSSDTELIGDVSQNENVILQQEPNNQSITQAISVEGTFSSCSQNLQEKKLDEFLTQNQTTYQQDNFNENSVFVAKFKNDDKPASDNNTLHNSQNVDNLSDNKDKCVKECDQGFSNKTQVVTPNLSSQTNSDTALEMSVSNINEMVSEVVSDTVKESQDQPKKHLTKEEKDISIDSNDVNVDSNSCLPLPESVKSVNCLEKIEKAEVSLDNSNILQSDDVAVLAEFGTMNYELQKEEKRITITKDQVLQDLSDMLNENTKDDVSEEKSEKSLEKSKSEEQLKQEVKSNDASTYEDDELDLQLSSDQSTENHRKVLQDIFADWTDENGEEENVQSSTSASLSKDPQDEVEMELQNLLSEDVQQDVTSKTTATENSVNKLEKNKIQEENSLTKGKSNKVEKSLIKSPIKSPKSTSNTTSARDIEQSPKNPTLNQSETKKFQSPRPGVKVPGSHLTSQIATTAEVNEVLKERLKEKQKNLQNPKTADIVFVKKMSQRLSSQLLAAAAASSVASSISSSQQGESNDSEKSKLSTVSDSSLAGQNKSATDNNELLAILEGDVDPDWSNLKPHNPLEENKSNESHSSSSKDLDPATERALALKQFLELSNVSSAKKKQTRKSGKSNKDDLKEDGDIIHISSDGDSPSQGSKTPKQQKENTSHNTGNSNSTELSVEESRSGRKRKLTEKAREHELSVKRSKVIKGKSSPESRKDSETHDKDIEKEKSDASSSTFKADTPKSTRESSPSTTPKSDSKQKKLDVKSSSPLLKTPTSAKGKEVPSKRSSVGISKKDTPFAKRKLAVKNTIRQKKAAAKGKAFSSSTTSSSKTTPEKAEKQTTSAPPKEKKKTVSEIDRLLQDEGIVNMLYDAEQPDSSKRLVPITKSQKKVMDIEKAERELKFRAKLVKNAVLRLRNSGSATSTVSPRSRRNVTAAVVPATIEQVQQTEKKSVSESSKSSEALDFVLPSKMRNAADASRIIRRHSSSSFSSTSASPRVSIDQPPESLNLEELEDTVKNKRKLSNDSTDKSDAKKSKKKSISKSDAETKESEKSPVKKEPVKKVTRSNTSTSPAAITPAKAVNKNKKVPKGKSSVESSPADVKSKSKTQDDLSVCLAETASALLSTSSTLRSSNISANRKKGNTNATKTMDDENVDKKKLFSNKEISVRHHGHLVQLILTPSMPISGIRNALTIEAMNEFREALMILKKDENCRVVLFTSTGTSFCEGLELSSLLHSNDEQRKALAKEMAITLKEFLRCLASFNKPIVAGVQGAAIGLGVTMLPLFDLVIASDKATFSTPYGKLGQIGEGTAVLALSRSLSTSVTNELLLGGRVLTANEALRAGLVTRVLWPDRFQGELLPSLKTMSEQSSRSMEATKALLRRSLQENLDQYLDSESFFLVQHWVSTECQEAMKAFIEERGQ